MVNWNYFPKNARINDNLIHVIDIFNLHHNKIDSSKHQLNSNKVLECITDDLYNIGYKVESGKKKENIIRIPVLFGLNGKEIVAYEVDAYNPINKIVIEVEAGQAVINYKFLKDFFQCCMMYDVEYLCIAVRNRYRTSNDFNRVSDFFESFYISNRVKVPLKGLLIIGY
jgi:hypothetical protein